MKLVDILVESLDGWPQRDSRWDPFEVDCVVQDPDGIIYAHRSHEESPYRDGDEWCGVWHNKYVSNLEVQLAEDHATTIVTKQMWLEAKAAKEYKETPVNVSSLDPNSTEYKIAVMQHYLNGGKVEVKGKFEGTDGWEIWKMSYEPQWSWHDSDFRIKPEPVEPAYSLPEIPWDVIEDKYKWFAFDSSSDGKMYGYLYTDKPEPCHYNEGYWALQEQGDHICLDGIKFNKGNAPWDKSLVKRPE